MLIWLKFSGAQSRIKAWLEVLLIYKSIELYCKVIVILEISAVYLYYNSPINTSKTRNDLNRFISDRWVYYHELRHKHFEPTLHNLLPLIYKIIWDKNQLFFYLIDWSSVEHQTGLMLDYRCQSTNQQNYVMRLVIL